MQALLATQDGSPCPASAAQQAVLPVKRALHTVHGQVVQPMAGATSRHTPETQVCPLAQAVAQAPQWSGSEPPRLTHASPVPIGQLVAPPMHFERQLPLWHA